MPFPLERVRADTPGVDEVVHLNNAGAALPPRIVLDTMVDHLRREAQIGGYEAASEAADREAAVYDAVARLIGAASDEIAIVENATRAWDMAVYGYPFEPGDRVLTGRAEYSSNAIALLQLRDRRGIEVVVVDDDEHGQISLERLERELRRGAAMVSLVHVGTGGGLVNPAEAVGELCARYGVHYVLDACQSAGQLPLDVESLRCDVLSGTGRKYLRGPRGVGFLFVRREAVARMEPPLLDLHAATWTTPDEYEIRDDARRFENWERSHAALLGLGAAVEYALELGVDAAWDRLRDLAAELRVRLGEIPGVVVRDKGAVRGGIVTFTVAGVAAGEVQRRLAAERINVSVTPASHARLDLPARGVGDVVRASVHAYNTSEELEAAASVVARIATSG